MGRILDSYCVPGSQDRTPTAVLVYQVCEENERAESRADGYRKNKKLGSRYTERGVELTLS